jgi:hypothetical protein
MKTILLSAFLIVIGSGVALAQNGPFVHEADAEDIWVSELLGANVHISEADVEETTIDTAPEGWEVVANVSEIVVSRDGTIRGVLLDVGGFLGIGARTVMVGMDSLRIVERTDTNEIFVVFTATRDQLEEAPEYDDRPRAERRDVARDPAVATPADPAAPADGRLGVREPAEGFERVDLSTITVDELTSAVVYDRFDERVSGISDVLLSGDGSTVEAVLIDVGGFLGIGARTVAVSIDQIEIFYDAQANDIRVYLAMTEQELENLPEYRR